MAWVMSMSASSTALARRNIGEPFDRQMTKSSRSEVSNETSPRTMSSKAMVRPSGIRKRTANPSDSAVPSTSSLSASQR